MGGFSNLLNIVKLLWGFGGLSSENTRRNLKMFNLNLEKNKSYYMNFILLI